MSLIFFISKALPAASFDERCYTSSLFFLSLLVLRGERSEDGAAVFRHVLSDGRSRAGRPMEGDW